jgi:hypothetical protein
MDPITIIAILTGLLIAGFLIFIENAFEKILNPILSLIGLNSSTGPLEVKISKRDQCLELAIENKRNTKARLAAIEVIDGEGKKSFPLPYPTEDESAQNASEKRVKEPRIQFSSEKINQGDRKYVYLNPNEFAGCSLESVSVLDIHGKYWSATMDA